MDFPRYFLRTACLLAGLLCGSLLLHAQQPQFRKWNIGASIGLTPLNLGTGFPSITGHYRFLGVEISPYPYNPGIALTYQSPSLVLFKRLRGNLDATLYFNRQNADYYLTWRHIRSLYNETQVGLLAGPVFYFLRRFNAGLKVGGAVVTPYGPPMSWSDQPSSYLLFQASIHLGFRLFPTFVQP